MKTEIEMYKGDMIAEYDDTPELRQAIMDKLMGWFAKNDFNSGESMQSDTFNIEAPEVMAEILDDIIKFKTTWK